MVVLQLTVDAEAAEVVVAVPEVAWVVEVDNSMPLIRTIYQEKNCHTPKQKSLAPKDPIVLTPQMVPCFYADTKILDYRNLGCLLWIFSKKTYSRISLPKCRF
jgi:hypothetical protein